MTRQEALSSPCTRRFVREVLELSKKYDRVDVLHDLDLVLHVLEGEAMGLPRSHQNERR